MTWLFRLSVVSVISTYLLIVLGGVTRVTGSGLGCEDTWPLCQGKPYPPLDSIAIIEYLHRTVAAYIGILVIVIAILAWRNPAVHKRTRYMALASVALAIIQGLLGAVTVWRELPADIVTAHLGASMLFLGATLLTMYFVALDQGGPNWLVQAGQEEGLIEDRRFTLIALTGALLIFVLILTGGATSTSGAALACDEWPKCINGELIPDDTSKYTWINLLHRFSAVAGAVTVFAVLYASNRRPVSADARKMARFAFGLILVQIVFGGIYVLTDAADWMSAIHLATAALLWATMLSLAVIARRPSEEAYVASRWSPSLHHVSAAAVEAVMRMASQASGAGDALAPPAHGGAVAATLPAPSVTLPGLNLRGTVQTVRNYVSLMKPGILTLLLYTTLAGMMVAAEGLPPISLVLWTMLGGILSAGGANVFNCYIDRDIDALMSRTRSRPTVTGEISPPATFLFGLVLTVASVLVLGLKANWLAAGLALAGSLFYVFVYTFYLKRRTPQNIVIGGAAGAMPPVVGWAAVTGDVSTAAVLMFLIIFCWTPPHFWALALLKQGEYGRAAVPMLPVVAGEAETRKQMLIYTIVLFAVCLALAPFGLGWIYLASAIVLNVIFIGYAVLLDRKPSKQTARRMFFYSIWYLALIFGAMVLDRLLLA